METVKTYYENLELDRYNSEIIEIRSFDGRPAVILGATIFYPEGGGQGADRGTINGVPVVDIQELDSGEILHFVDPALAALLKIGPAELQLNAERRRDLATQHTAQHLLSATILRLTGAPTVSMHLGDEICTIDVDRGDLAGQDFSDIEEAVQDIVEADFPILIHLCPPEDINTFPLRKKPPQGEEVIRVVEIDGYDYSPCCGTHLPSTGRIGSIKILGSERYKGMTRLSFIAGRRVLRSYRRLYAQGDGISRLLKVPLEEVQRGVTALAEKSVSQEKSLIILKDRIAELEADRIMAEEKKSEKSMVVRYFKDRSMDDASRIGRALQKQSSAVVVVLSGADRRAAAFCSRGDVDLRPFFKELFTLHNGKGGGGPSFYQGAFSSLEDLEALAEDLQKKDFR